ncbi:hypothetical protein KY284_020204 [Solanum tuberosum]|nr:hypothetical protein KY284_020204 [Solanum tuberosum]
MDNRIYFTLGVKSYDITESRNTKGNWFEWVESAKLHMRRMKLSRDALLWICKRLGEASGIKGKSFNTWRCKDISTYMYCSLKFNKSGRFISIIVVNGHEHSEAGHVTEKQRNTAFMRLRGEESYKEVIQKSKWEAISDRRAKNQKETLREEEGVLSRYLVGSFPEDDEIPSRNEVRRWAIQTWKGIHKVNIYDMNGIQFLFEFRSRKEAEHIVMGK